jgi:hypothetical protein
LRIPSALRAVIALLFILAMSGVACVRHLTAAELWNKQTKPVNSVVLTSTSVETLNGQTRRESSKEIYDYLNGRAHVTKHDDAGVLLNEYILMDGARFERRNNGAWSKQDWPSLPAAPLTQPLSPGPREFLVHAKEVGRETLTRRRVRHITLEQDKEAMARRFWPDYETATPGERAEWEEPRRQLLGTDMKVDVWIDEEGFVWKVRMTSSVPAAGGTSPHTQETEIIIHSYNQAPPITTPM